MEVGRSDLVAKYVGWTAKTVQEKFKAAMGGVLFIDEAYALADDRGGSFGDEAINTIVQEMENRREDLVVIFAGYPEEMERFLDKNPGLRSRIAFHMPFADYSAEELCDIAMLIGRQKGVSFSADAVEKLYTVFEVARLQPDFGNGRYARNAVEQAKMNMASRLLTMDLAAVTKETLTILNALANESLKWQALTYLIIDTGARRGEILGIKWDSVNFDAGTIRICNNVLYTKTDGVYEDTTKNYKNRLVAVSPPVMRVLAAWQEEQRYEKESMGNLWVETGFVFTQKTGKVMHPDSVNDWFGKFSKRNNLPPIYPHKFRHTQASLLIHEGIDIVAVSKRLGHSKVSTTTDIYSHILANADRSACDALDKIIFVPSSIDTELK